MAVAGVLSLMVTWWSSPLDRVRMTPFASFDQRGLVPVGYAAFAFVLGVTAGVLIRRTLPAMATALGGFVAARLVVAHWGRPTSSPRSRIAVRGHRDRSRRLKLGERAPDPRDWVISDQTINAKGQVIGQFGSIGPRPEYDRQRRDSWDHDRRGRIVSQPPQPDSPRTFSDVSTSFGYARC